MSTSERRGPPRPIVLGFMLLLVISRDAAAQNSVIKESVVHNGGARAEQNQTHQSPPVPNIELSPYYDAARGSTAEDLVRRALDSNLELAAARLDIERGRARLRQAGLRPNPSVDFEHTTGRLTGAAGERETSLGFSLPLDLAGKRRSGIDLAQAELEAVEAEVADRERRLAADVRTAYADAVAAVRELEITQNLHNLDQQTADVVQTRVTEGESAPIELNLLRVELERMRARRALVEGRLQVAMLKLKTLSGMAETDPLQLREDLNRTLVREPMSVEAAIEIALRTRPDLRLARLLEEVARAGLRLTRAQAKPDVTAFGRYTVGRSVFDNTPVGVLRDADKTVAFGVSIGIPVFNRNQGAEAEAAAAITQAKRRREFAEALVRSEVRSAYAQYEAARIALAAYEQGVLALSVQNIKAVRGAYEIGAFKVTDLLVEQRRYLDSQREFIETLAEKYRALANLKSAIGAPTDPIEKPDEK